MGAVTMIVQPNCSDCSVFVRCVCCCSRWYLAACGKSTKPEHKWIQ